MTAIALLQVRSEIEILFPTLWPSSVSLGSCNVVLTSGPGINLGFAENAEASG